VDHFKKLTNQVRLRIFGSLIAVSSGSITAFWAATSFLSLTALEAATAAFGVSILISLLFTFELTTTVLAPVQTIWRAILHIDPDHHGTPAPNLKELRIGRELINSLVLQIYQFASQENSKDLVDHRRQISQAANIVNHMPLPLFVFNKDLLVTNASDKALEYCKIESSELFGKSLFDTLRLEFPSERTLEQWILECQDNKVTETAYWERVHVLLKDDNSLLRQCDIAAYYNRDNPSGTEFIITLFDRTEQYNQDDNALGFVALAVHELRTPITMLRGYIEVFEEELSGKLDTELQSFLAKMESSAKHLSSFVSNILNVARIDQNQLVLHLTEESWPDVLKASVSDAELRAQIHGKTIDYDIASGIPKVAVDQVSIYEVLTNLIENAIKYSGETKNIVISSFVDKDGMIQTTVKDSGVGIPASVLPTLFEKFSRNHRTKSQVSGTGLGLYLSKSIITAHGGQIFASSKEGEGSTFGFTLQPYASLTSEQKGAANQEITRNAHGWIKNHSLYRR
jgi:signal transduction histidine kinase